MDTIMETGGHRPIQKYMELSAVGKNNIKEDDEDPGHPLKYFKGQDLELYYNEKQLRPGVEKEIKEGFFEIRKKFGAGKDNGEEEEAI